MYGLTRATVTLIASAVAGLLIWIATQISDESNGGYWAVYGLVAAAGLVMALSQLLGGWTKFGMPRLSPTVFLLGFLPVLVCVGWVLMATQPGHGWHEGTLVGWSHDVGIFGLVHELGLY